MKEIIENDFACYNSHATDGLYGDCHSGKQTLTIKTVSETNNKVMLEWGSDRPDQTDVFGAQIYSPKFKMMMLKNNMKYHSNMSKLAHTCKAMLFHDFVFEESGKPSQLQKEFFETVLWMETFFNHMTDEVKYLQNTNLRFEIFLEYRHESDRVRA